ncbi:MAG TPA: hypothetical protein VKE74_14405 [Gemmataceae bacterium]|nr:hypothetical protein [Gemmataceae bacterium]
MRTLLAAMLVVGIGGLVRAQDDDDPPEKYKNKDGKYAIAFPKGAKVKTMKQETGGITMYMATVESKGNTYAVMYLDFPDAVKDLPAKTLFDGAQSGAVGEGKGKLVGKPKDLTIGPKKYPAREFVVDKDGTIVRTRMVLADTRLYLLLVGGEGDYATGKEATAFLTSFEITK